MTEDRFLVMVLGVSLLATLADCADFKGTEFAVVFAEKDEFPHMSVSYILFTVSGPTDTLVTVSAPGHAYETTHRIGSNKRLNITLPEYTKHWNSLTIEPNGISVSASAAITVRCTNKYANVSQGYTAIPKHSASTNYLVVSHDPAGRNASYILITAYDNSTIVTVHFKFPRPSKCVNMDAEVSTGLSLSFTLNRLDVWGVRCDHDLTGTSVTSSAPVSVVSGLASLFSTLPFLETMLLPVDHYGDYYALPSYTGGSLYRVVAASDDTLVSFANNTKMLLNAGYFLDVPERNSLMCLTTNKPVQVVMLGVTSSLAAYTIVSSLAIPVMIPMVPVERFLTSYNLYVESSSTMVSEYITLMAPGNHIDELAASIQYLMITVNETSQCCNMSQITGIVPNGTTVNVASSVPFTIIYNDFHSPHPAIHGYYAGANLDDIEGCPASSGYTHVVYSNTTMCLSVSGTRKTWVEGVTHLSTLFRSPQISTSKLPEL
ncbi:IgGFc-binding protein-like [Haliotis asinina]|uniref:IgGFc-binding protein-like n=1 Tax=Haliotis asinina TaxID=109174 RepID=UPI003531B943